jgi:hypothetical protein
MAYTFYMFWLPFVAIFRELFYEGYYKAVKNYCKNIHIRF